MIGRPTALMAADALAVRSIGDVSLSPEGRIASYVVSEFDTGSRALRSRVWIVAVDGRHPARPVTNGPRDREPRWSPDGRHIACVTGPSTNATLAVASTSDWVFRAVTPPLAGLANPAWAPGGRELAFVAMAESAVNEAPIVIQGLRCKVDGAGHFIPQRQLWTVGLDDQAPVPISVGSGDARQPVWTPDGARIVLVRRRPLTGEHANGYEAADLWWADPRAGTAAELVSVGASVAGPAWSPDGARLAYYAAENDLPGIDTLSARLMIVEPAAGRTASVDISGPGDVALWRPPAATPPPRWSADGSRLLVRVAARGDISLIDAETSGRGLREVAGGERQILSYDRHAETIAYAAADPYGPQGLFVVESGSTERRVVSPNDHARERLSTVRVERRTFRAGSGALVDGWTYRSRGTGARAPFALSLHGGPHGYAGHAYSALHFYRYMLADRGWVVLTPNPTGSATYGRAFAEGVREQWGAVNYPELMDIVGGLCADGTADPDRLAVTGYSYGGYLAAWIAAQTSRFRAIVVGAPITNLESYFGTSDIGPWFLSWQMRGGPAERSDLYRRLSPLTHAANIVTPTLILQGDADQRCPVGQAEELYAAIHAAGRAPVELVLYPGGDHDFPASGAPAHRLDFHTRVVDWLGAHTGIRART